MTMVDAITLLFVCQLLGEVLHLLLGVPLPGSVIGMVLLVGWLGMVRKERPTLEAVTKWLTAHLSIMFVPFAVGIMEEGADLRAYWLGFVVAVGLSTIITLVVTAYVFAWALRRMELRQANTSGDEA